MAWTCETCPDRIPCMASVMQQRSETDGPLEGFYAGGEFGRPRCEDHAPRHIIQLPREEHPTRLAVLGLLDRSPKALSIRQLCVGLGQEPTKGRQSTIDFHVRNLVDRGIVHSRRDRDACRTHYYWLSPVPEEHLPALTRYRRTIEQVASLTQEALSTRAIGRRMNMDQHTVCHYRHGARKAGLLPPVE